MMDNAEIEKQQLKVDTGELVDAVWFTGHQLKEMLQNSLSKQLFTPDDSNFEDIQQLHTPPPFTIAYQLAKLWLNEQTLTV